MPSQVTLTLRFPRISLSKLLPTWSVPMLRYHACHAFSTVAFSLADVVKRRLFSLLCRCCPLQVARVHVHALSMPGLIAFAFPDTKPPPAIHALSLASYRGDPALASFGRSIENVRCVKLSQCQTLIDASALGAVHSLDLSGEHILCIVSNAYRLYRDIAVWVGAWSLFLVGTG